MTSTKNNIKRTGLVFKDITNGSMTPEVYTASGLMLLVFMVCQYIKSTETKERKKTFTKLRPLEETFLKNID